MGIDTNVLTTAGMMKMPFSASSSSGKMRLYCFLNQKPEDIAKIRKIFKLRVKGKIYEGTLCHLSKNITTKPYLLRIGNFFQLMSTKGVLEFHEKLQCSEQEMIQFYDQALKATIKFNDQVSEKNIYSILGNAYEKVGDYGNEITYYEKHLNMALKLKDQDEERAAYVNLGNTYKRIGDYRNAINYYEKHLKIAKNLKEETGAYYNLGSAYQGLREYQEAILYYKKLLKNALDLKDQIGENLAYSGLGVIYQALRDYQNAIIFHKELLRMALDLEDPSIKINAYVDLGIAFRELGHYKHAIAFHKKALELEIDLDLKDEQHGGKTYSHLGNSYCGAGDYTNAIACQKKFLQIALKLKNPMNEGVAYSNLGNAYFRAGNYKSAIMYHGEHLKIALKLQNQMNEGVAYANLGNGYEKLGDYRNAVAYYDKALKISLKLEGKLEEGKAYCNLGNAYGGFGDYKNEIAYQEKYLTISLELNNKVLEGSAYGNLGMAYQGLKDYTNAIVYQKKYLEISLELNDEPGKKDAYCNLGSAYARLGDDKNAITYCNDSLEIAVKLKDRLGEAKVYGILGGIYCGLGNYISAISYTEKALMIAIELGNRLDEGNAYTNLGHNYRGLGNGEKAAEYFQKGIEISGALHHEIQETKWQISLFEEWSNSYRGLEMAMFESHQYHKALEASDMRRGRALSSLISQKLFLKNHQEISLETLTIQKIIDLAKKIHTTFIIYSLLQMNETKSPFRIWIISSERKPIFIQVPDDVSLTPDCIFKKFPYSISIQRPRRGDKDAEGNSRQPGDIFKENLSSWYKSLIAPLEPYLPAKKSGKTLTFIPDDFLAHLPFGAFYNQKEDEYLIENYSISVAPSIQILSLLDQLPKEACHEVLLMGNPTASQKEDKALPYAEPEVRDTIAPMINHLKIHVLTQDEATPASVLAYAPSAKFIHIACHGVAGQKPLEKPDPNSVFEGLFKLAIDDDHHLGHLHAEEIASMSLKADLVFMSACHLGRGNLKQEGSIGPVWSFLGAGAKSTIASYWPLPDGEITVKMVKTFYKHYLGIDAQKLNKAKALQQAVLEAMKTERNKPRQWGAFFLSGLIE